MRRRQAGIFLTQEVEMSEPEEPEKFKSIAEIRQEMQSALSHRIGDSKVGERLRAVRAEKGISQRELSFEGCSYAYLSRIEAGSRRPSMTVLVKLALILDVSYKYLASGFGSPRPLTDEERGWLFLMLGPTDEELAKLRELAAEMQDAYQRLGMAQRLIAEADRLMGG